jgi:hypothetical protein
MIWIALGAAPILIGILLLCIFSWEFRMFLYCSLVMALILAAACGCIYSIAYGMSQLESP